MSKYIGFKHKKTIFRNIDKTSKSFNIGKIDNEYIVILQKENDTPFKTEDENSIFKIVKKEMQRFKSQIKKSPGSASNGKNVTEDRLLQNVLKIEEAIKNIKEDIKIRDLNGKIH